LKTNKLKMIAYSAGSLGTALLMQAFNAKIRYYYIDVLRLPHTWVGLAMTIYAVWNAINDPLAGQLSDRTRTRWGRRIPYILFGTLPLMLCFVALWIPPFRVDAGQAALLFVYFLLIINLFDTLWTVVVLNWTALFPEMLPDLKERAEVSAWRQVFSLIGLVIGVALFPMVQEMLGWGWTGVIFALIGGASLFASLLGSFEHPEFSREESLGFFVALRETFRSRSFRYFLALNLFIQFVFELLLSTLPFYREYVLRAGAMEETYLLGTVFLVSFPMLFLWNGVTQRIGSRQALIISCLVFAVAVLPLLFVESLVPAIIVMAFAGVGLAGLLMLTDLLLADIVDEDELVTGVRREGMFFGINGFIIRFGIAMTSGVQTLIWGLTGYDPNLDVQMPAAVLGLRLLMSAVPVLAMALAIAFTWLYPLHGERLVRVKAEVETLHAEKATRLGTE
jgi:GPH family glycoside/pentoside/hexuronide:cation symporter